MPELNPRRHASRGGRFAQVSAAVLAGMAAMFCLQNFVEFRREAALPPPPPPAVQTAPPEPEHVLAPPEPAAPAPKLAASSMMLKPEPGIAPGGTVLGVSGEEAPPKFKEYVPPPPPKAAAKKKKGPPHLTEREMESRFASRAVRQDGRFTEIKHRAPKEAEAVEAAAPEPEAPEVKPAGSSAIGLIEKAPMAPENLQPAPIAQLTTPEREFWTRERKFHIAVAVAVMIFGLLYLVYATGIKSVPERAEGEL